MGRNKKEHIILSGNAAEEQAKELFSDPTIKYYDLFEDQKQEMKKTALFGLPEEEQKEALQQIQATWIHYPWAKQVFKILPEKEFIQVRTSRNKHKITEEEQEFLATKKVGIVGLSVGRTVALTLALERACGAIRMADFDTIELSNLNRLKTPLRDYGIPKTTSTRREIHEIDPYFDVECYDDGLTEENIDDFFTRAGKLDLIIDECDSIEVKMLIRQKAKELRIPVLMDTSDRGMIDVERYDLDPELPLFNGLVGDFQLQAGQKLTPEEKGRLLTQIIDFDNLSERARYSLTEIGKSISTWPQLASSIIMGGGVTANIARRIFLKEEIKSNRYYIDLSDLIPDAKRG